MIVQELDTEEDITICQSRTNRVFLTDRRADVDRRLDPAQGAQGSKIPAKGE